VVGSGDARGGVFATVLSGGNCDFKPVSGAADGTRKGPATAGEGGTFRLGMNCRKPRKPAPAIIRGITMPIAGRRKGERFFSISLAV
jgi:hypothetical protein